MPNFLWKVMFLIQLWLTNQVSDNLKKPKNVKLFNTQKIFLILSDFRRKAEIPRLKQKYKEGYTPDCLTQRVTNWKHTKRELFNTQIFFIYQTFREKLKIPRHKPKYKENCTRDWLTLRVKKAICLRYQTKYKQGYTRYWLIDWVTNWNTHQAWSYLTNTFFHDTQ